MVDKTIAYTVKLKDAQGNPVMESNEAGEQVQATYNGQVTKPFPETVEEAVAQWGADVVLSKAVASVVIDIQRVCRTASTAEEAQNLINTFVPGVATGRSASGLSQKAILEALKGIPKDKLAELLAEIKGEA